MEPQPGDEKVFGDAWPLVDEWRRLRERHPFEGKGLAWLEDEERLRELEIALVGEHGLTMPPDTDPWDSLSRRTQVRWRTQTLERVHRERVLAQIRRRIPADSDAGQPVAELGSGSIRRPIVGA